MVVDRPQVRGGDLLYFRGLDSDRISHVAISADVDTIVHATVDTGTVTRESITAGSRAAPLMERLVAIRRLA
jgi:cell wall-associated NlpC family hydrolase